MKTLLHRLVKDFAITGIKARAASMSSFKVNKDDAERLIRELRDRENFTHLNFIACIDYIEDGIFTLVYMLHDYESKSTLSVHVDIDREDASMHSIHHLWAQAWTYQRELREMYGIDFPGSPRLEEDFCLEGWDQVPPMRREFDTKVFSEERFGHREGRHSEEPREHMHVTLYPDRGGDAK